MAIYKVKAKVLSAQKKNPLLVLKIKRNLKLNKHL